jgi:alkylhydroperoxidase family enzyme
LLQRGGRTVFSFFLFRRVLPKDWSKEPLPQWVRLLTHFPKSGTARVVSLHTAEEKGALDLRLKAETAWIAARQDRAWYAVGTAKQRLLALGLSEDAVYALDGAWEDNTKAERAAFTFARKLTAYPEEVTDGGVEELRKHFKDREVAELVYHITNAAFFDRVTEACGLRLEKP